MQKQRLTGAGMAPLQALGAAGTVSNTLTATGATSQANSLAITDDINIVTVTAANTGVRLPSILSAGDQMIVANHGASALLVFPPVGGALNGGSVNASISLATLKVMHCICIDSLNFTCISGA